MLFSTTIYALEDRSLERSITSSSLLQSSIEVKDDHEIVKILTLGIIQSPNENIVDYYLYSKLISQLGGATPVFRSVWYDNYKFRHDNIELLKAKQEHMIGSIKRFNPDYIIFYNFDPDLFSSSIEFLDKHYSGNYITIGFDSDRYNLNLNIDLSNFFEFLKEIEYSHNTIYILVSPIYNMFKNFIKSNDINSVRLTTVSELRNIFINLDSDKEYVVINNLRLLLSDVDAKVITKNDILNQIYIYAKNVIILDIAYENQYEHPFLFEVEWDFTKVFDIIDAFIVSSFYDIAPDERLNISIPSVINMNLENAYARNFINDYHLLSIDKILNYFNGVK